MLHLLKEKKTPSCLVVLQYQQNEWMGKDTNVATKQDYRHTGARKAIFQHGSESKTRSFPHPQHSNTFSMQRKNIFQFLYLLYSRLHIRCIKWCHIIHLTGQKDCLFLLLEPKSQNLYRLSHHATPKSGLLCEDKMLIALCSVLTSKIQFTRKQKWQMLYLFIGKHSS